MIGHLGAKVSALLDGQLSPAEEERAWEHVHACHACRDAVEREGWIKTQLVGLGGTAPSSALVGALLDPASMRTGRADMARRRLVTAAGGGAVIAAGAAALGVLALGSPPPAVMASARTPSAWSNNGGGREDVALRRTQPVAGPVSMTGVMDIANPMLSLFAASTSPFLTKPAKPAPHKPTRARSHHVVRGKMSR